jgi:hypothetical protein
MWDPSKFYDDLEHSIFKIMLECWDQSWFMTLLRSLWCDKTGLEQGMLYDENFLSLNLLGSEIL